MSKTVTFEQWVPADIERVFHFFAKPQNLPRIMPPATTTTLVKVKLIAPDGATSEDAGWAGVGSEIVTSFRLFPFLPFHAQWTARITEFECNHHFADLQIKGPFKKFFHRHELVSETRNGTQGTIVRDVVEYEVGYGFIGKIAQRFIERQLQATFRYRQSITEKLLTSIY